MTTTHEHHPQTPVGSRRTVVVVDGPSGSGKSSVSRAVAARLGFEFLDTGAAYRSLAWLGTSLGTDLDDPDAVAAIVPRFVAAYDIALRPDERWVRVGDRDVTSEIRETSVSAAVSKVARVQAVRDAVNALFRRLLADGDAPGIVAEGRDLTTVVAPDATVRVLMTADESVRIARRSAEKAGEDAARVAASVTERDAADSRVVDFLHAADGVQVLDTTHLDLPQTVQAMMDLITAAVPEEAP